jgi:hypothetical protein
MIDISQGDATFATEYSKLNKGQRGDKDANSRKGFGKVLCFGITITNEWVH